MVMSSNGTATMPKVLETDLSDSETWVRVEAIYSVLIPDSGAICSMVGQVQEVGPAVEWFAVGDKVIALASPEPIIMLEANNCLKLEEDDIVNENSSYWALILALMPAIRASRLELGERVLVLSSDLVGEIAAELTWLAGALPCVAYDSSRTNLDDNINQSESASGPQWVQDIAVLENDVPAKSVDLLIDTSGDPYQLNSNISRVRDTGRVLVVGQGNDSRFDFDLYPDIHKRSITLLSQIIPAEISILEQENERQHLDRNNDLDFVRHLIRTEQLRPSTWSSLRIRLADGGEVSRVLQEENHRSVLIEW
jgi:threonine dehydrogenase-like Zn-dependent dehydrogenase